MSFIKLFVEFEAHFKFVILADPSWAIRTLRYRILEELHGLFPHTVRPAYHFRIMQETGYFTPDTLLVEHVFTEGSVVRCVSAEEDFSDIGFDANPVNAAEETNARLVTMHSLMDYAVPLVLRNMWRCRSESVVRHGIGLALSLLHLERSDKQQIQILEYMLRFISPNKPKEEGSRKFEHFLDSFLPTQDQPAERFDPEQRRYFILEVFLEQGGLFVMMKNLFQLTRRSHAEHQRLWQSEQQQDEFETRHHHECEAKIITLSLRILLQILADLTEITVNEKSRHRTLLSLPYFWDVLMEPSSILWSIHEYYRENSQYFDRDLGLDLYNKLKLRKAVQLNPEIEQVLTDAAARRNMESPEEARQRIFYEDFRDKEYSSDMARKFGYDTTAAKQLNMAGNLGYSKANSEYIMANNQMGNPQKGNGSHLYDKAGLTSSHNRMGITSPRSGKLNTRNTDTYKSTHGGDKIVNQTGYSNHNNTMKNSPSGIDEDDSLFRENPNYPHKLSTLNMMERIGSPVPSSRPFSGRASPEPDGALKDAIDNVNHMNWGGNRSQILQGMKKDLENSYSSPSNKVARTPGAGIANASVGMTPAAGMIPGAGLIASNREDNMDASRYVQEDKRLRSVALQTGLFDKANKFDNPVVENSNPPASNRSRFNSAGSDALASNRSQQHDGEGALLSARIHDRSLDMENLEQDLDFVLLEMASIRERQTAQEKEVKPFDGNLELDPIERADLIHRTRDFLLLNRILAYPPALLVGLKKRFWEFVFADPKTFEIMGGWIEGLIRQNKRKVTVAALSSTNYCGPSGDSSTRDPRTPAIPKLDKELVSQYKQVLTKSLSEYLLGHFRGADKSLFLRQMAFLNVEENIRKFAVTQELLFRSFLKIKSYVVELLGHVYGIFFSRPLLLAFRELVIQNELLRDDCSDHDFHEFHDDGVDRQGARGQGRRISKEERYNMREVVQTLLRRMHLEGFNFATIMDVLTHLTRRDAFRQFLCHQTSFFDFLVAGLAGEVPSLNKLVRTSPDEMKKVNHRIVKCLLHLASGEKDVKTIAQKNIALKRHHAETEDEVVKTYLGMLLK